MRITLSLLAPLLAVGLSLPVSARTVEWQPERLSGNYLAGRTANRQLDLAAAAKYFSHVVDEDPANTVVLERTFLLMIATGQMDRAEELAVQVLEINNTARMANIVLGLRAARLRHYDQARPYFATSSYTPAGQLTAALLTAWTWAAEKNSGEALKTLATLDSNRDFANFRVFHTALIADYLGDKDLARQNYEKAYAAAPGSVRVVQAWGSFLERNGRVPEAITLYQNALKNEGPGEVIQAALVRARAGRSARPLVTTAESGLGEALFTLAGSIAGESEQEAAISYTRLAIWAGAEPGPAFSLLGDLEAALGQYPAALAAYSKVPLASPLRRGAETESALVLHRMNDQKAAVTRLKNLVSRFPGDAALLVVLGNVYRADNKFADAAVAYNRAIALMSGSGRLDWQVFYFRGMCYERLGQWSRAEADFRRALALDPRQPSVLNYLGYSMIDRGLEMPRALTMIQQAVALRPNDGYTIDSLGWAYYRMGDYAAAVRELERAVELLPADPILADHLGDAYWRLGRRLEARFQWQHARDSKPDPKDLARIDAKLKRGLDEGEAPGSAPAKPAATTSSAVAPRP